MYFVYFAKIQKCLFLFLIKHAKVKQDCRKIPEPEGFSGELLGENSKQNQMYVLGGDFL